MLGCHYHCFMLKMLNQQLSFNLKSSTTWVIEQCGQRGHMSATSLLQWERCSLQLSKASCSNIGFKPAWGKNETLSPEGSWWKTLKQNRIQEISKMHSIYIVYLKLRNFQTGNSIQFVDGDRVGEVAEPWNLKMYFPSSYAIPTCWCFMAIWHMHGCIPCSPQLLPPCPGMRFWLFDFTTPTATTISN